MMSRILGAPLGGTIRAGQYGFESLALRLMVPPNFCSGAGRYLPSMVVVDPGDPGVPVVCWARQYCVIKLERPHMEKITVLEIDFRIYINDIFSSR
jgi:hypothetical protein